MLVSEPHDPQTLASRDYPAMRVNGHRLHVFDMDGSWEVWLNTEISDFDGLCIGCGDTRDEAVANAVAVLESLTDALQRPA